MGHGKQTKHIFSCVKFIVWDLILRCMEFEYIEMPFFFLKSLLNQ